MPLATRSRTGVLAGVALLGAAVAALSFLVDVQRTADPDIPPPPDPVSSAAEVILQRFPSQSSLEPVPPRPSLVPAPAISPLFLAPPQDTTGEITPQARPFADHTGAGLEGSVSAPPRGGARLGRSSRAAGVLNEAQIASIKSRLKLAPDQESFWPPVEAALRGLAWRHAHERPGTKAEASLDREGVQRLHLAAAPLLVRLRDDQKRELKLLAHIIGLERLVSQF